MKHILIDAGNSFAKIATYNEKEHKLSPIQVYGYNTADLLEDSAINSLLELIIQQEIQNVWLSNVNNDGLNQQLELLFKQQDQTKLRAFNTVKASQTMDSVYQDLSRLGCDRWAAILAIKYGYQLNNYCVIDCGTAITIDLVVNGKHQGGIIAPGIKTSFNALNRNTAHLPELNQTIYQKKLNYLGSSTDECITAGVYYQAVALIEKTVLSCQKSYEVDQLPLYLTGGDAQFLAELSELSFVVKQNLVIEGLAASIKFNLLLP